MRDQDPHRFRALDQALHLSLVQQRPIAGEFNEPRELHLLLATHLTTLTTIFDRKTAIATMSDFNYGGTDEESAEIKKLNAEVLEDTDNFENWEKLVRAAESLEGGLNRNSSPQAIS